ncbi:kinase-like domain [Cordyceps militaris]|uniref:Kinase-like domain n=1 Tax=Cordyceps militaris TaxID=73501 RepID=A0A2H4SFT7_CORMI|nr:kinase-like domain [Cordyceps militaris]
MAPDTPLNVVAVVKLAASLRGQRRVTCRIVGAPLYGSFNKVVMVAFDDGLTWAFRTPRHDGAGQSLPPEVLGDLIGSEVATLNFLARHSALPVPRVIDHSCTSSNAVGVPYILMTCAPGKSFSERLRRLEGAGMKKLSHVTRKVMGRLGELCFDLSNLRFDKIGSIQERDGLVGLNQVLSPAFMLQDRHRIAMYRGPFATDQDYYRALAEAFLGQVQDLSMSHHLFCSPCPELAAYPDAESYRIVVDLWSDFVTVDDKIDSGENRIQYHTAGKLVQDVIPQLCASQSTGFPIGHADLKSSNIFVDEDCNITCIINWKYSSTMPLGQLLIAPGLADRQGQPSAEDRAAFRIGFEAAALGPIPRSPVSWILTDVLWHYLRWTHLDTYDDYRHFAALFSLHPEFAARDPLRLIEELQARSDIREARQHLAAGECEPSDIKSNEDLYFESCDDGERRRRVAEKLTERFRSKPQVFGVDFWMKALAEDFGDYYEQYPGCRS